MCLDKAVLGWGGGGGRQPFLLRCDKNLMSQRQDRHSPRTSPRTKTLEVIIAISIVSVNNLSHLKDLVHSISPPGLSLIVVS